MKHVFFPFIACNWMRLLQNRRLTIKTTLRNETRKHDYDRDPLAHPDIRRMSEQQKADLPFSAEAIKAD